MPAREVKIQHYDRETNSFVHVATIATPEGLTLSRALEYAWRWTNNVDGSWSRGEMIEGMDGRSMEENGDYNPATTVHVPLPVYNGKTYGLRSSMEGDIFELDDKRYRVAMVGFEEVDTGDEVTE